MNQKMSNKGEEMVERLIVDETPLESSSASENYVPAAHSKLGDDGKLEPDEEVDSTPSRGEVEVSMHAGPNFVGIVSGTVTLDGDDKKHEQKDKEKSKCCLFI